MRTAASCVLLLVACSQAPEISGVDPSEGLPGAEIKVVGERLGDQVSVSLAPQAGGDAVSLIVTERSAIVVGATVPETAAPGVYDLIVAVPGHEVRVQDGFTVRAAPVDEPCGKLYTANTAINAITGEVIVDRFYKDGKRETLRTKLGDITQVEYERVVKDDNRVCSVIFLRKADGDRFRFSDDVNVELKSRAYKLAQEIGKSVKVTREDPVPEPAPE